MIKAHKGEKYLKDNAEWLGYDEEMSKLGKMSAAVEKNFNEEKSIRDDARSIGMRTQIRSLLWSKASSLHKRT